MLRLTTPTLLLLVLAACRTEPFDAEVWRTEPDRRTRMAHNLVDDLEKQPKTTAELVALLGESAPCYDDSRNLCWAVGRMRTVDQRLAYHSLEVQVDAEGNAGPAALVITADPDRRQGPRKRDLMRRALDLVD